MKSFTFPLITIFALIAFLFSGLLNEPSPLSQTSTMEQTSTTHVEEDDEGWDCTTQGNQSCEPIVENVNEVEAYEVLSTLPIDPLAASGDVGYKYISSTHEAVTEVKAPYFYLYSPTDPSLKHLMKAEWLYKA